MSFLPVSTHFLHMKVSGDARRTAEPPEPSGARCGERSRGEGSCAIASRCCSGLMCHRHPAQATEQGAAAPAGWHSHSRVRWRACRRVAGPLRARVMQRIFSHENTRCTKPRARRRLSTTSTRSHRTSTSQRNLFLTGTWAGAPVTCCTQLPGATQCMTHALCARQRGLDYPHMYLPSLLFVANFGSMKLRMEALGSGFGGGMS
jgi:hypothetical protein